MTDDEKIKEIWAEIGKIYQRNLAQQFEIDQLNKFAKWSYDYSKYVCVFLVISGLLNGAFLITRIWV